MYANKEQLAIEIITLQFKGYGRPPQLPTLPKLGPYWFLSDRHKIGSISPRNKQTSCAADCESEAQIENVFWLISLVCSESACLRTKSQALLKPAHFIKSVYVSRCRVPLRWMSAATSRTVGFYSSLISSKWFS